MNKLIVTLASCCALGAFTASHADEAAAPRSVVVHFGDLDTATWTGAATLYGRLNGAAHEVCQDFEPRGELPLQGLYKSCLQSAIADAVLTVDRPVLTRYATARGVMSRPSVPSYFAKAVSERPILVAER